MSGICSAHRHHEQGCRQCEAIDSLLEEHKEAMLSLLCLHLLGEWDYTQEIEEKSRHIERIKEMRGEDERLR